VLVVVVIAVVVAPAGAAISAVDADVPSVVPFLFVALTVTRRVSPLSEASARYRCAVAEEMGVQSRPVLLQRAHW
jgi:hypothetical protein